MQLNYKTGKLPPNFLILGYLLLLIGCWRLFLADWIGIALVALALLILFIRSGIVIDTQQKRMKKYIGILGYKNGNWEDISSLIHLGIVKGKIFQSMYVASIKRSEERTVYKLLLVFPSNQVEILHGEKEEVAQTANEIAKVLNTVIVDKTV